MASAKLVVEALERRDLPTANAVLVGGTLTITGGPNRDRIDVDLDLNSGTIIVRDAGLVAAQFPQAVVTAISIDGGDGDDVLRISQDLTVPATINGGAGNDLLFAGGGPTLLIGGPGNDKLVAGSAPDTMLGGAGGDLIIGSDGVAVDTIDGGPNADCIQRVTAADIITPDPLDSVRIEPPITFHIPTLETPLNGSEVDALLKRAAAATASDDGIVAIVDREGKILGIRVEGNVDPAITGDPEKLVFAIDGAVAKARTAAFFANDQAPLTSRTVEFISQSTITQREVEADPNLADPLLTGPGFVAPVGVGGHFPPGVMHTPQVDLFEIEHTNRDFLSGPLTPRFNATFLSGKDIQAPDSYGLESGFLPSSTRGRGIATLPGGIPLYKKDVAGVPRLVGGIGVFFPGKTGFATEENSALSTTHDPTKRDRSLEAEYIAAVAAAGLPIPGAPTTDVGVLGVSAGFNIPGDSHPSPILPNGLPDHLPRIDLVGITLDTVGPGGIDGLSHVLPYGETLGIGDPTSGAGRGLPLDSGFLVGEVVPDGWLVAPHDGVNITAGDVRRIIQQGINEANLVRAAIRLPLDQRTRMVFAVTDSTGAVLGLYRMPDATYFSIDVAVAKARNVAYYADSTKLQAIDNPEGTPPGTAFTNRTFRYLGEPRFPEGVDGAPPGPFSQLNDGGANPNSGLQVGPRLPSTAYTSVIGHDSFFPGTNFRDISTSPLNQNGIVFFSGSAPIYKDATGGGLPILVGGFGVSGDGVDQDDVVTFFGAQGYTVPASVLRADQTFFRGVRLPYQKFNRNPED